METELKPELKGSVLIVEDDKNFAELIRKTLQGENCVTMVARTLKNARECLMLSNPDIIILDIMLPDGNGLDFFVDEIKGKNICSHVIFLTAKNESNDVITGLNAGGIDYIKKPCNIIEVRQRIINHLHIARELNKQKINIKTSAKLPKRELVVACLAAEGMKNKDIAKEVYLSESRVKFILGEIYNKLGISKAKNKRETLARIFEKC